MMYEMRRPTRWPMPYQSPQSPSIQLKCKNISRLNELELKCRSKNVTQALTFLMWDSTSPLPRLIRVNMTLLLIDSSSCGDCSCGFGTTNNGSNRIMYAVIWKRARAKIAILLSRYSCGIVAFHFWFFFGYAIDILSQAGQYVTNWKLFRSLF